MSTGIFRQKETQLSEQIVKRAFSSEGKQETLHIIISAAKLKSMLKIQSITLSVNPLLGDVKARRCTTGNKPEAK